MESPADLPEELPSQRVGVVVQTTQSQERLAELVAHLAPRTRELLVHNTICSATEQRQTAAMAMADAGRRGGRRGGEELGQHPAAGRAVRGPAAQDLPRGVGRRARPGLVPRGSRWWASPPAPPRPPSRSRPSPTDWQDSKHEHTRSPAWPSSATPTWASRPSSTASPARRDAVVAPESGVTRDRKEGEAEWIGREFIVVDTGGIDLQSDEPLGDEVRRQAQLALEEAAVAIFLVDGKIGPGPPGPRDRRAPAAQRRCRSFWPSTSTTPRRPRRTCTSTGSWASASPSGSRPSTVWEWGTFWTRWSRTLPEDEETPETRRAHPGGHRRPAERGQELAAQRPPGRPAHHRLLHPGHHPGRHRHRPDVRRHAR